MYLHLVAAQTCWSLAEIFGVSTVCGGAMGNVAVSGVSWACPNIQVIMFTSGSALWTHCSGAQNFVRACCQQPLSYAIQPQTLNPKHKP